MARARKTERKRGRPSVRAGRGRSGRRVRSASTGESKKDSFFFRSKFCRPAAAPVPVFFSLAHLFGFDLSAGTNRNLATSLLPPLPPWRHSRVLLDEINLAASETLQRLSGLDGSCNSVTLAERGDDVPIPLHPDFRLFAAMNPATDAKKKDLPAGIRSRFTELYVDETTDLVELRKIASRYLRGGVVDVDDGRLDNCDPIASAAETHVRCRRLSEERLSDGSRRKPRYTTRTLCRAASACQNLVAVQGFDPQRAMVEGFEMSYEGMLGEESREVLRKTICESFGMGGGGAKATTTGTTKGEKKDQDRPGRRPGGRRTAGGDAYVLCKPFWIRSGEMERIDWAEEQRKRRRRRCRPRSRAFM